MVNEFLDNATISAIVGGVSGGLVSLIGATIHSRRERRVRFSSALRDALEDLQLTASAYWRENGPNSQAELIIKKGLEKVDLRLEDCLKGNKVAICREARSRLDELTDLITGGDFETAARSSNLNLVSRIKEDCSVLRGMFHD